MNKNMNEEGFRKLFWGFFFILLDFRIQGIDILPDIIGYILFASGFTILAVNSEYFKKASSFNIPMTILSVFTIYERPNQNPGFNIKWSCLGALGILIGIASLILGLLVVYYLFMGIKDMSEKQEERDIYEEADRRWHQYLLLQIAVAFAFVVAFIPMLGVLYIIALLAAAIILSVAIMGFMKRCGEILKS